MYAFEDRPHLQKPLFVDLHKLQLVLRLNALLRADRHEQVDHESLVDAVLDLFDVEAHLLDGWPYFKDRSEPTALSVGSLEQR